LKQRPRRLRTSPAIRALVGETVLNPATFIMPYFVVEGKGVKQPIPSMPGQYRFSIDKLYVELDGLQKAGVRSILLFGIPQTKSDAASGAFAPRGVVQMAIQGIKKRFPELLVIADTCVCAYTRHGHCGVIKKGEVTNDPSTELIAKVALSQVESGADMVAPSDMMDGRVGVIRDLLDSKGYESIPIMSYSAKYASSFYGPFRDAQKSSPKSGDRKTYQMDPSNGREAIREMELDMSEGADILMVKPALSYLDIIQRAKDTFDLPIAAFSVSGEYAMIKVAAREKLVDEKQMAIEVATSIYRAGADILISYYAKDLAKWLS
jgi:porphobilinogen synthase